jgi:hypothetical protein
MASDPMFIIGSGRSGTTLTARCLGAHPEFLFIDEPRFLNDILLPAAADQLTEREFKRRLQLQADGSGKEPMKFLRRLEEHYGERLGSTRLRIAKESTHNACQHFWQRLSTLDRSQRCGVIRDVVATLTELTTAWLGGRLWLIKQPDLSCCLEELCEVFPNARFIHVVRQAEDVVSSRLDHRFQADFEEAFDVWRTRLEAIVKFSLQEPHRVLHVCFEDLVRRPDENLGGILTFCGLAITPEVTVAALQVHSNRAHIGRSWRRFTCPQRLKIKNACRHLHHRLTTGTGATPAVDRLATSLAASSLSSSISCEVRGTLGTHAYL